MAAVRVLTDEGASLRAVLAPAGYGKTTMLHTAAQAATADGRPVVAVATTAKAVAELAGAGLDARTIARLRIDLTDGPLAAGTVVVLDEISQTPTARGRGRPGRGGRLPGRDRYGCWATPASPNRSGRAGPPTTSKQLATAGRIPSARLTVNRRQVDAADRQALDLLRRGEAPRIPAAAGRARLGARARQPGRDPPGHGRRRSATTSTRYGAEQVAALVVSHTDAEDLADRIRARLADSRRARRADHDRPGMDQPSVTTRPATGCCCTPASARRAAGWSTAPPPRSPASTRPGSTVRLDRSGEDGGAAGQLRAGYPQGRLPEPVARVGPHRRRGPGRHLGGLPPARQRRPGRLPGLHRPVPLPPAHPHLEHHQDRRRRPRRDPRRPARPRRAGRRRSRPPARSHPGRPKRPLDPRPAASRPDRRTRAGARRPACRPPSGPRRQPPSSCGGRRRGWRTWTPSPRRRARQLDDLGALAGLSRHGRDRAPSLQDKLAADTERASAARDRHDQLAARVEALRREQDAFEQFEITEGWRHDELPRLRDRARSPLGGGGSRMRPSRRPARLWDRQAPPRPYHRRWPTCKTSMPVCPADRSTGVQRGPRSAAHRHQSQTRCGAGARRWPLQAR